MPHYRINAPGQHGQNVKRLHEDARDYIKKVCRSVRFPLTPGDHEPKTYRGARHFAIRVRTWANVRWRNVGVLLVATVMHRCLLI